MDYLVGSLEELEVISEDAQKKEQVWFPLVR